MRSTWGLLLTAAVAAAAACDVAHADDRERKVRVALALAAPDPEQCGKCREDVDGARADAVRDRKPLVLFVGGPCGGLGCAAEKCGAVIAKTDKYDGDGRPADERRIVILEPKADGSGLWISQTLPAKANPLAVAEAVDKAKPVAASKPKAAKLVWDF